ncbi:hypothetical protein C8R45DRAFT_1211273 [Mycena sanguinolenta]|nr:hypothetical protein C8R45DRAFT_1211273 [Mycena sanguinolenta]
MICGSYKTCSSFQSLSMCLPLCTHRCWQYNPDLWVLFPQRDESSSLHEYLESFSHSIRDAPKIPEAHILSVSFGRTRGKNSYPFLIIYLEYRPLFELPVRLKLQGFDGPVTGRLGSSGEGSTFTVGYVKGYLMELVGTWRYDVFHTMKFPFQTDGAGNMRPSIVDLLALADLSTKWDHSREGYPSTLFLALKNVFNGVVASRSQATPLPSSLSAEARCAVVHAFPIRRQGMQREIDFRSGCRLHPDETKEIELQAENLMLLADNAELQSRVDLLEGKVAHPRSTILIE